MSSPAQVFADSKYAKLTYEVEQILIDNHVCFQIIYNQHLDNLERYRVLVLPGCIALSDQHIKQIERYVQSGGRVCIIGPAATHDEWMSPRQNSALDGLPDSRVVRVGEDADLLTAIRRACDNQLSLEVEAEPGLCAELTEQPSRRLVHLVNYRADAAFEDVPVRVRLPAGRRASNVSLASPERPSDLKLPYHQEADIVAFIVPEVSVYEIAVISTD